MKPHPVERRRPLACALPHRQRTSLDPPAARLGIATTVWLAGFRVGRAPARWPILPIRSKLDDRRAQRSGWPPRAWRACGGAAVVAPLREAHVVLAKPRRRPAYVTPLATSGLSFLKELEAPQGSRLAPLLSLLRRSTGRVQSSQAGRPAVLDLGARQPSTRRASNHHHMTGAGLSPVGVANGAWGGQVVTGKPGHLGSPAPMAIRGWLFQERAPASRGDSKQLAAPMPPSPCLPLCGLRSKHPVRRPDSFAPRAK